MSNGLLKDNIGKIGIGIGSAALIGGVSAYAVSRYRRKKKSKKRKSYNKIRRKRRNVYRKRYRRTPHTAGKRKDRSHKRIRYTKNGQPYIIMGNGRARFIKKKGAKISHKRSGGRY